MTAHKAIDEDEDLLHITRLGVMRCPECELIHIGMLNDEGYALAELTVTDTEVLEIAVQLLEVIYPSGKITTLRKLMAQIDDTGAVKH